MALFCLLSALLFGTTLVRRIPFPLYRFEAAAMAVVLGLFLWTWLMFLAVLVLPYDAALPVTITVATATTFVLWRGGSTPTWRPLEGGRRAWFVWGAATAITAPILIRLFWTHSLVRNAEGIWTAGATWGDYGAHASYISHFAAASSLPTDLSIASGEKITYPFLIDLLSAMYTVGGFSLHSSLFWPGVLLSLAICQLLITVGLRLFGRISVGVGGLALTLTMGSAAGTWAAWNDWRDSGQGLFTFLRKLPSDYSQVLERNAHVTNMVADGFLPQRAILFGLGIGLIVLILLHTARDRDETWQLWPAAVLVGLLPMGHAHTFMVGGALLAAVAVDAARRTRAIPKPQLGAIVLALVLAAPQIVWQQTANGRGTGGRFKLGWMVQEGESIFGFYWANFGLFGLAFLAVPFVMRKHRNLIWFLPMLALFGVAQLYAFQPFEYDNLKLISWAFVVGGFFIAYLASELVRRHKAWLLAIVPASILVMVPGSLAIAREFELHDQFASPADIALADWANTTTPTDAVFVATDRPNNPVATLAGRKVVLGFRGWLYSYNVPYTQREEAVKAGLAGRFDDPALRHFGADYLLVAASEDPSWTIDEAALSQKPLVWSNDFWRVYKIS
jgi:uncharacterized membrane protein YjjB (DUF3815 family)